MVEGHLIAKCGGKVRKVYHHRAVQKSLACSTTMAKGTNLRVDNEIGKASLAHPICRFFKNLPELRKFVYQIPVVKCSRLTLLSCHAIQAARVCDS